MAKTFFISDLHLGDKGSRDNFKKNESKFRDFLRYVRQYNAKLYILGDLCEWWQVHAPSVINAYYQLLQSLEDMGCIYITGNHDNLFHYPSMYLKRCNSIPDWPLVRRGGVGPIVIDIDGKLVTLMHGHEVDKYCRDMNPGIGNITAIVSGLLEDKDTMLDAEKIFMDAIEHAVGVWRYVHFRGDRIKEMERAVAAFKEKNGSHVVVYGHTHNPGETDPGVFNCGSWCEDKCTFVMYDSDLKKFTCEEWR